MTHYLVFLHIKFYMLSTLKKKDTCLCWTCGLHVCWICGLHVQQRPIKCCILNHKNLSDVISELIQTELHHVRTLRIMDGVFRRGMLEEVQLELGVVHVLFPCLERLLMLHTHFLTQLLTRRAQSLQHDSANNFTITQISDLLIQQVGV